MRAVLIGASHLAVATAHNLSNRGHEVVIIERDRDKIEALNEQLDCGFLHGDGSRPALLAEADAHATDVLFCLTNFDQDNIIASLVSRSLGFRRVITKIEDAEFEHICTELGLEEVIVPDRALARNLADLAEGHTLTELSSLIRGDLRLFSLVIDEARCGPLEQVLDLPEHSRVICIYRGEEFILPKPTTRLMAGDEVLIATHSQHLAALRAHWLKS